MRYGYLSLILWITALIWQVLSFITTGLIGTAVGGHTGAYIFAVASIVGLIMYISGVVLSIISLKRDSKKILAWISLGLQLFFILLTLTLVVGGFVIRF